MKKYLYLGIAFVILVCSFYYVGSSPNLWPRPWVVIAGAFLVAGIIFLVRLTLPLLIKRYECLFGKMDDEDDDDE